MCNKKIYERNEDVSSGQMEVDSDTQRSSEEDILVRSTKRNKSSVSAEDSEIRPSYRDKVRGMAATPTTMEGLNNDDDDDASDDDVVEDLGDDYCFSMGMSRQEKISARRPWRTTLIIKLVGRRIGYRYLLNRLQAMSRIQSSISLMDLPNDFYIIRFRTTEDYNTALLDGSWLIGDHCLHVQRWNPNFLADMAEITHLPVWVRFLMLPIEYYSVPWLQRAGNKIGKTIKVDATTLLASRGRFARVCIEVDLRQPLKISVSS